MFVFNDLFLEMDGLSYEVMSRGQNLGPEERGVSRGLVRGEGTPSGNIDKWGSTHGCRQMWGEPSGNDFGLLLAPRDQTDVSP